MISPHTNVIGLFIGLPLAIYTLWFFWSRLNLEYLSHIPVAPGASWIWGNEKDLFFSNVGSLYHRWFLQLGNVYRVKGALLKPDTVVIGDPVALAHVMQKKIYEYPRSPMARGRIRRTLGNSLAWVEGQNEHRRMRGLVAPVLTPESVRAGVTDVQNAVSQFETRLVNYLEQAGGQATVNIMDWMSAVTMDIIGRYGFGHDFAGGQDPVAQQVIRTWRRMSMIATSSKGWIAIMTIRLFPFIDRLPLKAIKAQAAVKEMLHNGIAQELANRATSQTNNPDKHDLMSLLHDAYTTGSMSRSELLDHITFFIMAGYETTAQVLGYAVWQLARHPDIQNALREEVACVHSTNIDDLQTKYPLLDAVCRESLRLSPSVAYNERVAQEDDIIPLSTPIRSTSGELHDRISIRKGQLLMMPFHSINRLVWEDGEEFRPQRWMDPSSRPGAEQLPRGWSGILTFGDGPRNCLGYRLALLEFKCIMISLVRHVSFHDTEAPIDFKISAGVQAYVRGREVEGPQLPVHMKLL